MTELLNTLAILGLGMAVIYQGRVIQSHSVVVDSMGEALTALLDFVTTVVDQGEQANKPTGKTHADE